MLILASQGGWSLRWLNIFFTPAFVMLALSPAISGIEVGKIIAVFSTYLPQVLSVFCVGPLNQTQSSDSLL